MNNIFKLLPEDYKKDFSVDKSSHKNFVEEDMQSFFQDKLYLRDTKKGTEALYIFSNVGGKNKKTLYNVFLKALMKLNQSGYGSVNSFIYNEGELNSSHEFLKKIPVGIGGYAPDFEYMLKDILDTEDSQLKTEMKLKLFAEASKFILKDRELLMLFKTLANNS